MAQMWRLILLSSVIGVTACSGFEKPFSRGDQRGGSQATAPDPGPPPSESPGPNDPTGLKDPHNPKPEPPDYDLPPPPGPKHEPSQNDPGQNDPGQNDPGQNGHPPLVEADVLSIQGLTHNGGGCAPGTVAMNLAPDAKAFTMTFSEFTVENGGDVPVAKNACAVQVKMAAKPGWAFAIMAVQTRGYATLDPNALGVVSTWFSLNPNFGYNLSRLNIPGVFDQNYQHDYVVPVVNRQWSGCQGQPLVLNLVTELAISSENGAQGFMAIDSLDGELRQEYAVAWKKCN